MTKRRNAPAPKWLPSNLYSRLALSLMVNRNDSREPAHGPALPVCSFIHKFFDQARVDFFGGRMFDANSSLVAFFYVSLTISTIDIYIYIYISGSTGLNLYSF